MHNVTDHTRATHLTLVKGPTHKHTNSQTHKTHACERGSDAADASVLSNSPSARAVPRNTAAISPFEGRGPSHHSSVLAPRSPHFLAPLSRLVAGAASLEARAAVPLRSDTRSLSPSPPANHQPAQADRAHHSLTHSLIHQRHATHSTTRMSLAPIAPRLCTHTSARENNTTNLSVRTPPPFRIRRHRRRLAVARSPCSRACSPRKRPAAPSS